MIINGETAPSHVSDVKLINPWRVTRVIIMHVVAAILLNILYYGVNPVERAILCDDDSIRYPYEPDTVSTAALMSISILVPYLIIVVAEVTRFRKLKSRVGSEDTEAVVVEMSKSDTVTTQLRFGNRSVHPLLYHIPNHMSNFSVGFLICVVLTLVGKVTMGELRPHFLDVCKPDWNRTDCTTLRYFNTSACQGDPATVKEGRQSFPSGHASISAYAATFAILYLQKRAVWSELPQMGRVIIIPVLQWLFVACALFTGLSRVADNHHRLVDVICGWILGTIVAIAFTCRCLLRKKKRLAITTG